MPETNNETVIKNTSWGVRLALVCGWTGLCAFIWFMWIGSMASQPDMAEPGNETALGLAACMATGCTGGIWFFGLVAALVVYGLIRR